MTGVPLMEMGDHRHVQLSQASLELEVPASATTEVMGLFRQVNNETMETVWVETAVRLLVQ
jgi:hypothetical protein